MDRAFASEAKDALNAANTLPVIPITYTACVLLSKQLNAFLTHAEITQ